MRCRAEIGGESGVDDGIEDGLSNLKRFGKSLEIYLPRLVLTNRKSLRESHVIHILRLFLQL